MIRISLIGPGDIKYHYQELLKIPEKKFKQQITEIAKILAKSGNEIVLLPDRGICFEIAKKYKEFKGEKVSGTVPVKDKDFGIKHLRPYISAKINGKKVFDELIDTNNWYKQDLTCCIYGDIILMLGNSLGSLGELSYGYYLYKLFCRKKPEVKIMKKKIHQEVKAGDKIPFSVIIYKPFFKEKLNPEIESYIKKMNCKIYYAKNPKELKTILNSLK